MCGSTKFERGSKMTLAEFKEKIFPSVYKTRSGKLVKITGFAFQGHFLDEPDGRYIWDDNMNFIETQKRYGNLVENDLIENIKGPTIDPMSQMRKEKKFL